MTEYINTTSLLENVKETEQLFDEFVDREMQALQALRAGADNVKESGLSKFHLP